MDSEVCLIGNYKIIELIGGKLVALVNVQALNLKLFLMEFKSTRVLLFGKPKA